MNFLTQAASSLGNRLEDRLRSPDTMFGKMADRFGLTHADIATPSQIGDPMQFQRGMQRLIRNVPGMESQAATPEQETFAQQNGFKNYNEMLLWSKQRSMRRDRTPDGRVVTGDRGTSLLDTVKGAIADPASAWDTMTKIHPKNMFESVTQRMKDATSGWND